jgi:hypothetical protein
VQPFINLFKNFQNFFTKMTCGYCSGIGHTMRHCNSTAAQNLLADYRRTCLTPRTDEELNRYFRSFTSDMLSLIMYSYGASSVSVNRAAKEQFIRERILQARGQPALVIDLTVVEQNQPRFLPHSPVGPPPPLQAHSQVGSPPQSPVGPPPRQAAVRETMAAYKARMQVVADIAFDLVCVRTCRITTHTDDNAPQFGQMIEILSAFLISETHNSMPESIRIMKLIIKKFHLRRVIAPVIKQSFFVAIYREHMRVNEIRITEMRAQGLLPQLQQQLYVPHKPQFAVIQMSDVTASEAEDYCCGICSEEFTKETIPTLGCNHTMCAECISGQIKARTKSCIKCPYCREEVKQISVQDNEIRNQIATLVAAEVAKN